MMADYHVHTCFSHDSKAKPEAMIAAAMAKGMSSICFTEHCDFDAPAAEESVDIDAYMAKMLDLQAEYRDQIDVRIGIELGLQPHLVKQHHQYVNEYPLDFVIGSLHVVEGKDPYYPATFEGKADAQVYDAYFKGLLENVRAFSGFQVVGHIDYVVRYGNDKVKQYSYAKYADIIDEILTIAIARNIGIEVNTGGLKAGLGFPNPHQDVIKRYKELGGEIITIGSDAHSPEYVGYEFENIKELLKNIGFDYVAQFCQKEAEFIKI